MKVYNLTDVPTSALEGSGLVNSSIRVGSASIAAGGEADVASVPADCIRFFQSGALSYDRPESYVRAKAQAKPVEMTEGTLSPSPAPPVTPVVPDPPEDPPVEDPPAAGSILGASPSSSEDVTTEVPTGGGKSGGKKNKRGKGRNR